MKKEKRQIYVELTDLLDWQLCSFCKFDYPDHYGDSPCDSGDSSCHHPLGYALEDSHPFSFEPGMDCWGFRPINDPSFCADIVGIVLSKGWTSAGWFLNKANEWIVYGNDYTY